MIEYVIYRPDGSVFARGQNWEVNVWGEYPEGSLTVLWRSPGRVGFLFTGTGEVFHW